MHHERTKVFRARMAHHLNLHDTEEYSGALWEVEHVPYALPPHIYHNVDMGQPVWIAC